MFHPSIGDASNLDWRYKKFLFPSLFYRINSFHHYRFLSQQFVENPNSCPLEECVCWILDPFISFPFPSFPFPSLPFPSFPFVSLPFPSFPFLFYPILSFSSISFPFPFLSFPFLSVLDDEEEERRRRRKRKKMKKKKEQRREGKVPFPLKEGKVPGSNSAKVVFISGGGGGPGGTLELEPTT